MHTTSLRKVGGSIMLAVPPVILDMLHLAAGATVGVSIENGRLVIEPTTRPHYTWMSCSLNAMRRQRSAAKISNGWIIRRLAMSCCDGSRRYLSGVARPYGRP